MSTYLELCQDLVSELGLAGIFSPAGDRLPTTVSGNTNRELNNVTRWIRAAALQIDNLWLDWKYLWNNTDALLTWRNVDIGTQYLPDPPFPGARLWDLNRFNFRPAGAVGQWQPMVYYPRQELADFFDTPNATPGTPGNFTITPQNRVFLANPTDDLYDFTSQYWQRPVTLTSDDDIPKMPPEHHRIIMARACIMYGNREDAPEIISGLEAEYIDMLDKLQTDQLEGHALRRSSTDRERDAPSRGNPRSPQQWL